MPAATFGLPLASAHAIEAMGTIAEGVVVAQEVAPDAPAFEVTVRRSVETQLGYAIGALNGRGGAPALHAARISELERLDDEVNEGLPDTDTTPSCR